MGLVSDLSAPDMRRAKDNYREMNLPVLDLARIKTVYCVTIIRNQHCTRKRCLAQTSAVLTAFRLCYLHCSANGRRDGSRCAVQCCYGANQAIDEWIDSLRQLTGNHLTVVHRRVVHGSIFVTHDPIQPT